MGTLLREKFTDLRSACKGSPGYFCPADFPLCLSLCFFFWIIKEDIVVLDQRNKDAARCSWGMPASEKTPLEF